MAVTATLYDLFREKLLTLVDPIDFAADDIRGALVTDAYTPDREADEFWDDVTGEVSSSGTGYTTGGQLLTSKVIAVDGTGHYAVLTADDLTWATTTLTAHYLVLRKDTGDPATSPLIGYQDFGGNEITVGVDFVVTWPVAASGGVLKI
jgi:hypothetical protein